MKYRREISSLISRLSTATPEVFQVMFIVGACIMMLRSYWPCSKPNRVPIIALLVPSVKRSVPRNIFGFPRIMQEQD